MLRISLVVVVAFTLGCPAAQKIADKLPEVPKAPVIAGKFANEGCIAQPAADGTTNYMTLAFDMTPSTWAVDVVMFADEKCTTKQGTMHFDGPYTVLGPSTAVPGAFESDFAFSHRTITPHVDGFIGLLQSFSCGKAPYAVNQPQDVHESGCKDLGVQPAATCPKEHDIVKVEGDGSLRFGKRPADGNICSADKRPTALEETALKPVK